MLILHHEYIFSLEILWSSRRAEFPSFDFPHGSGSPAAEKKPKSAPTSSSGLLEGSGTLDPSSGFSCSPSPNSHLFYYIFQEIYPVHVLFRFQLSIRWLSSWFRSFHHCCLTRVLLNSSFSWSYLQNIYIVPNSHFQDVLNMEYARRRAFNS